MTLYKRLLRVGFEQIYNNPLYRNAYALVFSTVSTSGLGMFYWIIAARLYTPETVGFGSAAISTMMFVSGLAQLNMTDALGRFLPNAGRKTTKLITLSYATTGVLSFVIATIFAVGYLLLTQDEGFLRGSVFVTAWFIVAVAIWTVFALQDSILTGLRQAVWIPIENTIFSIIKIVLLVLFAVWLHDDGIMASWTIPVAMTIIPINILIFRRLIPQHIEREADKEKPLSFPALRNFVTGTYIASLFHHAYISLPPLLVTLILGPQANAYFYIPWLIGNSFDLLPTNMTASLTVEGARDEDNLPALASHLLKHMLTIMTPLAIVTIIGAPIFLQLFGADYASEGASLMQLLAISIIPSAINFLNMGIYRVRQNIGGILRMQIGLCAGVIGLGVFLLPSLGIVGFGISWLAAQIIMSIYSFFELRGVLRTDDKLKTMPFLQ